MHEDVAATHLLRRFIDERYGPVRVRRVPLDDERLRAGLLHERRCFLRLIYSSVVVDGDLTHTLRGEFCRDSSSNTARTTSYEGRFEPYFHDADPFL